MIWLKNVVDVKKTLLKSNINKNKTKRKGFRSECRLCSKECYYNKRDRLLKNKNFIIKKIMIKELNIKKNNI